MFRSNVESFELGRREALAAILALASAPMALPANAALLEADVEGLTKPPQGNISCPHFVFYFISIPFLYNTSNGFNTFFLIKQFYASFEHVLMMDRKQ